MYARSKEEIDEKRLLVGQTAFPKNVMISAGVSKLGKTSIIFVEPGVKVNGQYYRDHVLDVMLEEMQTMSNGDYIFLQDGARAHTAKATLQYLENHCPDYIPPNFWPPRSPDLNVLDFSVWSDLETRVWKHKPADLNELKTAIVEEWAQYPQTKINNSIDAFRRRLKEVINVKGAHIELYK